MKHSRILIIDDDPDVLTAVKLLLKREVNEVIADKNPENIPAILSRQPVDLVLLDMNFKSAINTGNEGLYWLNRVKALRPDLPVIMITAYGAIDLAVNSLKQGATDFIVKPWQNEHLLKVIGDILTKKQGKRKEEIPTVNSNLIGESDVMKHLLYKISKIAPTDANILILGENGTGKDVIADTIHRESRRVLMPYVKVDVGALTDTLFESELFGHKKGAYTDAREDRVGRFEAADKGTLFLDEIGNISLQQQAKLLSVLQNRQVIPLGSNTPTNVDIRLLCATNVPLAVLANENRFRKDLIYRINTVEVQVPPLRERGNDILLLARHFMEKYATKYAKQIPDLEKKTEEKLLRYHYPGNVRELQYSIERATIMAEGGALTPEDVIFSPIEQRSSGSSAEQDEYNLTEMEKNTIMKVIEKHNGNISKASQELGLTRTALYRRLSKYNI
ncbi:sigma-54-dependent transcriptional regulator [Olivibacter domesticus]|uniref:DNA-binding transcriptional response regulator, NtrC family, contains REC, AAA-type ATPase, and a Fis-type DNA-binding domains n=1 Tax=Olivibacter domesticus TaxID=407022 RepID=A0A1H7SJP3_OLID1|nr:sigma-54 dependent transcriptional regulator [Olivibacter domesticus]SEL72688.1 DNA-binding transcriptional response regulator, NtrC family, contains REC, AAA-type ATPase, and a Fis-type DNA-binding domains [Olivibacter domesticus]